jgi:DNA (cytosine-5)-methyltransferase 1
MGFPDSFAIPVSDTQAYRQFGNAVVVPVIESLAKALVQQANFKSHMRRQLPLRLEFRDRADPSLVPVGQAV